MGGRRRSTRILLSLALSVAAMASSMASAEASPAAADSDVQAQGYFTCYTEFPEWPSSSSFSGNDCTGTFVGQAGFLLCPTGCSFVMTIERYNDVCVANEPSLVGTMEGVLWVGGRVNVGHYDFFRTGFAGAFNSVSISGAAAMRPTAPIPMHTCTYPAPNYGMTITGAFESSV